MFIAVLNKSKRVKDTDVATMTAAVNWQMKYHVCAAYQRTRPAVVHLADESQVPPGSYVIGIFDSPDEPNVLGWHTEDQNGNVFGRVFANPTLDAGYAVLDGEYSITSVLSHEVIEAFVDPTVSDWAMGPMGTLYAKEACDPVESDIYQVHATHSQIACTVSNFVFPEWWDPQASGTDRFDQLKKLSAPFSMDKGGYYVYIPTGSTQAQQAFGDTYPEWKKQTKRSEFARTAKRRTTL